MNVYCETLLAQLIRSYGVEGVEALAGVLPTLFDCQSKNVCPDRLSCRARIDFFMLSKPEISLAQVQQWQAEKTMGAPSVISRISKACSECSGQCASNNACCGSCLVSQLSVGPGEPAEIQ